MAYIGIDYGTTNTVAALLRPGKKEVEYTPFIRSAVSIPKKGPPIPDADYTSPMEGHIVLYATKRLLSTAYASRIVNMHAQSYPYKLYPDPQTDDVAFYPHERRFTPEDLAKVVFLRLRQHLEDMLDVGPDDDIRAVLTVPEHFTSRQRRAVSRAAEHVRIEPSRIISEPMAASLAYITKHPDDHHDQHVMVYDIGGGTLDVTILRVEASFCTKVSSSGVYCLGGEDLTNLIKARYSHLAVRGDAALFANAEKIKRDLGDSEATVYPGTTTVITRRDMEEAAHDFFEAARAPVAKALRLAKLNNSDIHAIVLAGGSSRVPRVNAMLREMFPASELVCDIDPDRAIAHGAALQACILNGDFARIRSVGMVVQNSIGIHAHGVKNQFATIIPRGKSIPCSFSRTFTTCDDNQERFEISVYEDNELDAHDPVYLVTLSMDGIPRHAAGAVLVVVTISMDESGIVHVHACIPALPHIACETRTKLDV